LHAPVTREHYRSYEGTAAVVGPVGDTDCDGVVGFGDIDPFAMALVDPVGYAQAYPLCDLLSADINGDGTVDLGDISPFVNCLTSGVCP
jgi:hypothetical protein